MAAFVDASTADAIADTTTGINCLRTDETSSSTSGTLADLAPDIWNLCFIAYLSLEIVGNLY